MDYVGLPFYSDKFVGKHIRPKEKVDFFTEKLGRVSFMVKIPKSSKAKMGADVIGQHIVGEIVMGTGKVGIDGDAALAFVSKRIFICHLCLSLRSAVS